MPRTRVHRREPRALSAGNAREAPSRRADRRRCLHARAPRSRAFASGHRRAVAHDRCPRDAHRAGARAAALDYPQTFDAVLDWEASSILFAIRGRSISWEFPPSAFLADEPTRALPIGLQFAAAPWQERRRSALALAYESATVLAYAATRLHAVPQRDPRRGLALDFQTLHSVRTRSRRSIACADPRARARPIRGGLHGRKEGRVGSHPRNRSRADPRGSRSLPASLGLRLRSIRRVGRRCFDIRNSFATIHGQNQQAMIGMIRIVVTDWNLDGADRQQCAARFWPAWVSPWARR